MGEPARAPESSSRSVTVRVGGAEYRLKAGEDEGLAQEAAGLVNSELQKLRKGRNAPLAQEALVLAALNLAGELIRLRRECEEEGRELGERADALLKKISKLL